MPKIVVLGAGTHSCRNHLPALARYAAQHPGQIELSGLCDLRRDHAKEMAAQFGFARVYTDLGEMLAMEQPQGCVAVTPTPVTAQIAAQVIQAGVPLLMEKPPGATLAEAREIAALAAQTAARVMVSMNRRFDPALRAAQAWWGERPVAYVRGTIIRRNRREPDFMYRTAIHPLDTMRAIAGDVQDFAVDSRLVDGVRWFVMRLVFESGALGVLEVLPNAGYMAEFYEFCGAGCRAVVRVGKAGVGEARCWEQGRLALQDEPARSEPDFVYNGTYDETVAFVTAIRENRAFYPSPAKVVQTVELCTHAMASF
jgi:predicted dehydrogenase